MKRIPIFALVCLYALPMFAQTQTDRLNARGTSVFDALVNRAYVSLVGATPSVGNGQKFKTANSGVTTITNFTGGLDTQDILVVCADTNTTIANGSNIVTASGLNFSCTALNLSIAFVYDAGQGKWLQKGGTGGGGGGGGTPHSPSGSLQTNDGVGGFGASGASDDGMNLNIDRQTHFKGPDPYIDLARYGLYQGGGGPITCSSTATSAVLACTGVGDFAVGQGLEIPLAGVAPAFEAWGTTAINSYSRTGNVATYHVNNVIVGPPQTITITGLADATFNVTNATITHVGENNDFSVANAGADVGNTVGVGVGTLTSPAVTVTPSGLLNGTLRYDYKVVLRDFNGALSVASPAGTTTTGAALLGNNVINITSCSRASGVVTCITAATHNLQVGVPIVLSGTSTARYDGQHVVASTPTGTTFTYDAFGLQDDPGPPTGGTITVTAKNTVRWNMQQYRTLQSFVYRSVNSGAYVLVGIVEGMDGAFVDWNLQGNPLAPQAAYISTATPTAVTVNGILAARITAISGNNVTLATAATASASSQPAAHDNSTVVYAACTAIGAGGSGIIRIPNGGPVLFNSALNLRDNCSYPSTVNRLKIQVNGAQLVANEPIIARDINTWIESVGGGGPLMSFTVGMTSEITGNAYPLIYVPKGNGPSTFKNFLLECVRAYQSCVVEDQSGGGAGVVNTDYENMYFNGNGNAGPMPFIARGGAFYHRWRRGAFDVSNAYSIPESLQITIPNALGLGGSLILGGDMIFDQITFIGKGVVYETWGQTGQSVGFVTYTDPLYESGTSPLIRFNLGPGGIIRGLRVMNPSYSDSINLSTPMIEFGVSGVSIGSVHVYDPQCAGPLFASGGGGIEVSGGVCDNIGASSYSSHSNQSTPSSFYQNASIGISGGQFYTQMANPPPVASLAQSAGGSVNTGLQYYSIVAVDINGNQTLASLQTGITVSGANHTVTVTPPTLPVGAVGYQVYRNFSGGNINQTGVLVACGQITTPILPGVPFVDTVANVSLCGSPVPLINVAATSTFSSTGVTTPGLKLTTASGFVDAFAAPITANRVQTFPDVTGIVPVSSYLNSAYDTFNRANGAIGNNWFVVLNGLNVSSNTLVGTAGAGARNLAIWATGLSFGTPQFAQVTIANAGNGTDDAGVVVNSSGVDGTFYKCVESTTTLRLMKLSSNGTDINITTGITGVAGDVLRLENNNGVLTCYRNGTVGLTTTDANSGGHPNLSGGVVGVMLDGTTVSVENWSGGNLHPLAQLDLEQDWTKVQHFNAGFSFPSIGAIVTGVQGTDSNVLTAGTTSGSAGVSFCTDGNGGATTTGCSGGTGTVTHTAGALNVNIPVCGNGGADIAACSTLDNTATHAFFASASAPGFRAIAITDLPLIPLASGISGTLPIANNCPGATGASSSTFLRGDCTWATPAGAGTVTHTAGALSSGQLMCGNAAADSTVCNLGGDATTAGGTTVVVAKVNGNNLIARAFIPAGACINSVPSTWWNTTISAVCNSGSNVLEGVIPFADAGVAKLPVVYLPPDWISGDPIDVSILFYDASTSGTVIFNIATMCSAVNGTVTDDQAFNANQAMGTITLTTPANGQWMASKTNVTNTGCAANQPLRLKITRATDTASGAANVVGIYVAYRHNNAS